MNFNCFNHQLFVLDGKKLSFIIPSRLKIITNTLLTVFTTSCFVKSRKNVPFYDY